MNSLFCMLFAGMTVVLLANLERIFAAVGNEPVAVFVKRCGLLGAERCRSSNFDAWLKRLEALADE